MMPLLLVGCTEQGLATAERVLWEEHPGFSEAKAALNGSAVEIAEGAGYSMTTGMTGDVGSVVWDGLPQTGDYRIRLDLAIIPDFTDDADGVAVTLLDPDKPHNGSWLAQDGGCLGYATEPDDEGGECIGDGEPLPGVTIEVDTWQNRWDEAVPELALTLDGDPSEAVARADFGGNPESFTLELMVLDGRLSVSVDDVLVMDAIEVQLPAYAYVVASSANGWNAARASVYSIAGWRRKQ